MSMLLREIRHAVRSLSHAKGFAVVGILCLGLGIGINTAIFSIIDGVLLKPYSYDDPDRSDPNLPVFNVRTLEEVRRNEFWQFGLYGWIFGTIGVVGVLLASIGVYGVPAYSVSQRTQEIGVRVTLGADRPHVFKLILGQGLTLTAIGIVSAWRWPRSAHRWRAACFTTSARSILSASSRSRCCSSGVALAAGYVPARRAMKVDAVVALRQD